MHTFVDITIEPNLERPSSVGRSSTILVDNVPSAKVYVNPTTRNVSMRVISATADYVSRATLIDYCIHAIGVSNAEIRWAIGSILASEHLCDLVAHVIRKTYRVIFHDGNIKIMEIRKNETINQQTDKNPEKCKCTFA